MEGHGGRAGWPSLFSVPGNHLLEERGACVLSDYSSWFWTCTTQAPVLAAPISQMGEVRPHSTGVK